MALGSASATTSPISDMSTITSIPPEILIHVFDILACEAQDSFVRWLRLGDARLTTRTHKLPPYSWIKVTHVSQTWRVIALEASSLWSFISVRGEEQTFEMVRRAGSQPLTVAVPWPNALTHSLRLRMYGSPTIQCLPKLLASHSHQIHALIMPKWNGALVKMSSPTSPLRKLVLISPAVDATNDFLTHAWTFPQLEEFDSAFPLGSSLAAITSSTLKKLMLPSTDLRSLADTLRKTLLLEELHIAFQDSNVGSTMPLPLYSLRSLRLVGEASHCAALFRLLELPQDAHIAIFPPGFQGSVTALPMAPGNMPDILQQLVSCAAGGSGSVFAPVISLDIAFSAEGCRISGWRRAHVLPQSRTLASSSPDVRLGLSSDTAIGDAATLLSSFGSLQGLQVLHINLLPHTDTFLP